MLQTYKKKLIKVAISLEVINAASAKEKGRPLLKSLVKKPSASLPKSLVSLFPRRFCPEISNSQHEILWIA